VDWCQDHILKLYPKLDGVILGLGYDTIRGLVNGQAFDTLPNVAFRSASGEIVRTERTVAEVDDLPAPIYRSDVYRGIEHLIPLMHISLSNQACPNRCAFCPRPPNYGHVVRRKPIEHVLDEVEELRNQGIRHFRIADSTPPPKLLTDFAQGVVDRGLHKRGVHFTAFARIDQNRQEDFGLLRHARFEALFFGLETLDDEGLVRIHKGIEYTEIRQTLEAAHEAGLFVVGSLIFPLPGETEQSRANTFARLREIAPLLDSVLIQPAGVYPTSDWGMHPDDYGIWLDPNYIEMVIDYPIKFIIPMRFWPPFPFSYPLMGKDAREVTFDDIRVAFESFSSQVWKELGICNVQDYTLLIADMVGENPYRFTDRVKEVLVTRNVSALQQIVRESRRHLPPDGQFSLPPA
jgi:radical SAM superfamily enzyme YgiQ (UPF0313 family)